MSKTIQKIISKHVKNGYLKVRHQEGTETDYKPTKGIIILDRYEDDVNVISIDSDQPDFVGFTTLDFEDGYDGDISHLKDIEIYKRQ